MGPMSREVWHKPTISSVAQTELRPTLRKFWDWHLTDFTQLVVILVKAFIVASMVLCFGWLLEKISHWLQPTETWSGQTIKVLSDLLAIGAFLVLSIRDLWHYSRRDTEES